ncbi:MAG: hypothetical protein WKF84_20345 [Pyrinomonadaceae bacterium]
MRRSNQAARRLYENTKNTFACRFYDRIGVLSPCESPPPPPVVTATLEFVFDTNNNFASRQHRYSRHFRPHGFVGQSV